MFLVLLQKEIHDSLLSLRFTIAFILCMILIPVGMYVNLKDYEKRLKSYQQSEQIYQQDHPTERSVSRFGGKGFRKPSLFSIFSIGLEYYLPTTVHSDPQEGLSFSNDYGIDNPQSMLLGKIDLLFNVSIVLSLLAILFTFNSVVGEKETGTLKLTLSNTIPRHIILLSKLLGTFLVLFIPFLLSLLVGALLLLLSGQVPLFSAEYLPRVLLMVMTSILLISLFFNLGICISSLTQRSITAIVVLLLLWVFSTLAFPRISTMIAEVIRPVTSDMVFALEKSAMLKSLDEDERAEYSEIWKRVGEPGRSPVSSADSSQWDRATYAFMMEREPVIKKYQELRKTRIHQMEQNHANEKQRQSAIAMNISRLSPSSCYMYAMSTLAGTGLMEEMSIKTSAHDFEDQMQNNVYSKVFIVKLANSTSSSSNFEEDNPPPHFQIMRSSLGDVMGKIWLDLVLLVLFNILLFTGGYVAFLKYDVR
jgi:ABC-type transport system involved in multi-copper enzyme maturation permease subunit